MIRLFKLSAAIAAAAAAVGLISTTVANAADIKVLSSVALTSALDELAPGF